MSNFDWNQDDSDDDNFADRPQERVNGQWQDVETSLPATPPRPLTPRPASRPTPPTQEEVQEMQDEDSVDQEESSEEEDYSTVLSDAKLRLAQGSLYELLMNNALFGEVDVDPKAVRNVEKEIKNFAKERMEIMLGMRQERSTHVAEFDPKMANPFNDLEVQALKALASAATKGATQAPEAQTFTAGASALKKNTLTPIGSSKQKTSAPVRAQTAAKPAQKLPTKAPNSVRRQRSNVDVDQILAEEGVSREELEATFPETYKPIDKGLDKLTEQEILNRNKEASQRLNKQPVKSASAIPMPDLAQQEMIYTQRAQAAASHPQMANLMTLLTAKKN